MTFNKFKVNSDCVGGRHISATKNIYGEITSSVSKVLIGYCSICDRKKSMTVSDNTIKAEGLGSVFKNLGKISAKAGKKLATNILKNPGRALKIGANVATAAASRNPKAALSTLPEVIIFLSHKQRPLSWKTCLCFYIINGPKTDKLYPSAPLLENIDLEKRLEKKLNDVSSFNNHIGNIKEMIIYFKDKNNKSKKKSNKYKRITTILKSFDTFVIIAKTYSSITLSLTKIGFIVIPISTASACALLIGNKVKYEVIINKHNKYKKQYERDQETNKFLINHKENLHKILWLMKTNMRFYVIFLLIMLMKTKESLFYKHEYKNKIKLF